MKMKKRKSKRLSGCRKSYSWNDADRVWNVRQQTEQKRGKEEQNKVENKKISVVATIFPQYDFVRQIAGENVELKMLFKTG